MNNHFKNWVQYLILIPFMTAFLSGCGTTYSRNSQETVTLATIENQKIAHYVVNLLLLNGYSVEKTNFFFDGGKHNGHFGKALESQLQKTGYTLVSTDSNAQKLTYLLDELVPDTYRVDIRVDPHYEMDLVYRLSKNDSLVLHSVTVRNGSSLVVSCCNMAVEVNDDTVNDSKAHGEIKAIDIATRTISSEPSNDSTGDSLDDYLNNDGKDGKKENTNSAGISKAHKAWVVQVISLSEDKPSILEAISRKIEAMGYKTHIAKVGNAKKVRIGPFDSRAAVEPVLDEMRSNGYPDAFLWKQNP